MCVKKCITRYPRSDECVILDSSKGEGSLRPRYEGDGNFICVYFGRLVCPSAICPLNKANWLDRNR